MTKNYISRLWPDALANSDREAYVSDWALSSVWEDDPESDIPADRIDDLGKIWDCAHMSVKDICKVAGLSQVGLASRFAIPTRTVEDWCRGQRTPPDYVRLLLALALDLM